MINTINKLEAVSYNVAKESISYPATQMINVEKDNDNLIYVATNSLTLITVIDTNNNDLTNLFKEILQDKNQFQIPLDLLKFIKQQKSFKLEENIKSFIKNSVVFKTYPEYKKFIPTNFDENARLSYMNFNTFEFENAFKSLRKLKIESFYFSAQQDDNDNKINKKPFVIKSKSNKDFMILQMPSLS